LIANLAGVLAMGLGAGYAARYTLKLHFERPNPRRWLGLLKASFPFGIIGVVGESSRRFDTVFMSFVLTYAAVGWYNVPYNLVSMLLLLAQSLALSMFPSLVKEYDSGRGSIQDTVQRAMRYLLLLSLPISIGGTLLADPIIVALYGPSFRPAVPVLQIMLWTLPFMFLAEILGRTVITLHQEKKAAWVVTLNALLTVALDIVLIPKFGTTGAALVMVVGQLVNVLFSCVIIGPGLLFKGNLAPLLRVVSAGALMGIVVWLMSQVPLLARASTKLMLLTIVGSGAMAYSLFALAFKAVSSHEARYVYDAARRRLNRSA
jgi:O-antigen/teichoic acid export membrane protein